MPYKNASIAERRAAGAARSRKFRANQKARLQQITGIPESSLNARAAAQAFDCGDRVVLSFTHRDWSEGRVSYHRFPNPDINSTSTVILVMTPKLVHNGFEIIESDRLPQSATKSPGHLQSHWSEQAQLELDDAEPGTTDRSESPERH